MVRIGFGGLPQHSEHKNPKLNPGAWVEVFVLWGVSEKTLVAFRALCPIRVFIGFSAYTVLGFRFACLQQRRPASAIFWQFRRPAFTASAVGAWCYDKGHLSVSLRAHVSAPEGDIYA